MISFETESGMYDEDGYFNLSDEIDIKNFVGNLCVDELLDININGNTTNYYSLHGDTFYNMLIKEAVRLGNSDLNIIIFGIVYA